MDNVRPLRPKKQPPKPRRGRRTRRRIITSVVVAIVVLVLVFGSRILGLYVDWLWFGEVGLPLRLLDAHLVAGARRRRRLRASSS